MEVDYDDVEEEKRFVLYRSPFPFFSSPPFFALFVICTLLSFPPFSSRMRRGRRPDEEEDERLFSPARPPPSARSAPAAYANPFFFAHFTQYAPDFFFVLLHYVCDAQRALEPR